MKLRNYIKKHYADSQALFAATVGVQRQQVTQWLKKDFIVVEGHLYSPRRVLPGVR
jgi:hypothetical protein